MIRGSTTVIPQWLSQDIKSCDTLYFASEHIAVGAFRCSTEDSGFLRSGPYGGCYFVFPRTFVKIVADGACDFVSTPLQMNCFPADVVFRRVAIGEFPDDSDYFSVSRDWIDSAGLRQYLDCRPAVYAVPCPPRLYLTQRRLMMNLAGDAYATWQAAEADITTFLRTLAMQLKSEHSAEACEPIGGPPHNERRQHARIEKVKDVIARNLTDSLRLEDVAAAVSVTPWHLSRQFRKYAGTSLHQYVMTSRLYQSLEMLHDTELSIAVIAQNFGFSHHSHFTGAFNRLFGCTPNEFRKSGAGWRISKT